MEEDRPGRLLCLSAKTSLARRRCKPLCTGKRRAGKKKGPCQSVLPDKRRKIFGGLKEDSRQLTSQKKKNEGMKEIDGHGRGTLNDQQENRGEAVHSCLHLPETRKRGQRTGKGKKRRGTARESRRRRERLNRKETRKLARRSLKEKNPRKERSSRVLSKARGGAEDGRWFILREKRQKGTTEDQ